MSIWDSFITIEINILCYKSHTDLELSAGIWAYYYSDDMWACMVSHFL